MFFIIHTFKIEYLLDQWVDRNSILSEASHHWCGRKAALGLRHDRIRTLVSMAAYSSHIIIMGKSCEHSSAFIFAGNKDNHKISDGLEIRPDPTTDCGVSCP